MLKITQKIVILFLASMLLLSSISVLSIARSNSDISDVISLSFSFDKPEITKISIDGQQFTRTTIAGLDRSERAGSPALPKKTARVLLPPHTMVKSIEIEKSGKGTISGIENIELGAVIYQPLGIPDVDFMITDPDESNVVAVLNSAGSNAKSEAVEDFTPKYDSTRIYPENQFTISGIQYKRGFPVLIVDLYPMQYDAPSKTLTYYTHMDLKVSLEKDSSLPFSPLYRGLSEDFAVVGDTVDNPSVIDEYREIASNSFDDSSDFVASSDESSGSSIGNMLIITTDSLKNVPGPYNLQALADVHKEHGMGEVYIETVESIYMKYPPVSGGNWDFQRSESLRIRSCIKEYYLNKGVDYVLLVGDDDYRWENGMILPLFFAPLLRDKNIVDNNEVPTFQLYLYTVQIWGFRFDSQPDDDDDNDEGPPYKEKGDNISRIPGPNITRPDVNNDNNGPHTDKSEDMHSVPDPNVAGPGDSSGSPSSGGDVASGQQAGSGGSGIAASEASSLVSSDVERNVDSSGQIRSEVNQIKLSSLSFNTYLPSAGDVGILQRDDPRTPDDGKDGETGKWILLYSRDITTASDLPYACLDVVGSREPGGKDKIKKGPSYFSDLLSEVYVGRAPVSDTSDLKNFVKKTISYMDASDDEYDKVLNVGEHLGFGGPSEFGADSMNELIDGCDHNGFSTRGIPSDHYIIEKLYAKLKKWTGNTLIDTINKGNVGLVNHLGHANVDFNMKIGTPSYRKHGAVPVSGFRNDQYPIFYSQGCFAGAFDSGSPFYHDCIAEYLTVKNSHAGVAGIWNSHFGWGRLSSTDGPSQRYHREFIDAIFGEGKSLLGVANQDSKEDNIGRLDCDPMLWLYYCINLFGDPALHVHGAPAYTLDDYSGQDDSVPDEQGSDDVDGNDASSDDPLDDDTSDGSGSSDDGNSGIHVHSLFYRFKMFLNSRGFDFRGLLRNFLTSIR